MSNVPGHRNPLKVTYTDEEDLLPPPIVSPMDEWKTWSLWAGLLALLVLIAHLPMLGGKIEPVYLDDVNFLQNPFLINSRGWIAIWRFPHSQFAQFSPLGYSLLWLEGHLLSTIDGVFRTNFMWKLGGPLRIAHFTSIFLHLFNVLLLWTLLRKLDIRGAWLAAAVFAVHPLQVQSVHWISAQPLLLATCLGLSSLIIYLRFCGVNPMPFDDMAFFKLPAKPWALYIVALLLFLLAILARPSLAILPGVILLLIWWERGGVVPADLKAISPFLFASCIVLAGTLLTLFRDPLRTSHFANVTLLQQVTAAGRALWMYLLAIVFPYPLAFVYPKWNLAPWQLICIPAAVLALIGLWILRKKLGRALPASGFLFVLSLLPAVLYLSETNLRGAFLADSCAYLAVAVAATGIASLLAWKFSTEVVSPRHAAPWIAALVLIASAAYSIALSIDYRDPEKLLKTSVKHYPDAHFARVSLAQLKLAQRKDDDAAAQFREVLQRDPENRGALLGMASILSSRQQNENAMGLYLQVLRKYPNDMDATIQLSLCHLAMGNSNRALQEAQSVLERDPNNIDAYNNLAIISQARGEYDRAMTYFNKAVELGPNLPNPRINRASLHFALGDPAAAEEDIMAVLKNNPNSFEAIFNAASMVASLAATAQTQEQRDLLFDRAEYAFRAAVSLRPDAAIAHFNLGKLLYLRGHYDEAGFFFKQACRIEPANREYQEFLARAISAAGGTP